MFNFKESKLNFVSYLLKYSKTTIQDSKFNS